MKKKKKTDLRSEARVAAEKPISKIDKNDKAVVLARMHEIKKYKDDISSTQNTIGYTQMFKDGICQIDDHRFSKTIQFFDTNYQLAEFEEQNGIFSKYCDLINYFDNMVTFQLTFESEPKSGRTGQANPDSGTGGRFQRYSCGIFRNADLKAVVRQKWTVLP